jgi:hypothetical protein
MIIIAVFAAFPGLAILAAWRWQRAATAYVAMLGERGVYHEPDLDEVVREGPIKSYRDLFARRETADRRVRGGEFGPDAMRLLDDERQGWYSLLGAIPLGLVLVAILYQFSPSGTVSGDQALAFLGIVAAVLSAVFATIIATRMVRFARNGQMGSALAFAASLAVLLVATAAVVSRIID